MSNFKQLAEELWWEPKVGDLLKVTLCNLPINTRGWSCVKSIKSNTILTIEGVYTSNTMITKRDLVLVSWNDNVTTQRLYMDTAEVRGYISRVRLKII